MYGDIPEEYYDAAANMIWDFGEGIDEMFANHPDAISPALGLIENNDEDRLAALLWNLKILEPQPGPDSIKENKMKITKNQLKQIIRQQKPRLQEGEELYTNLSDQASSALDALEACVQDCLNSGCKDTDILDTVEAMLGSEVSDPHALVNVDWS